ncbi:unnamed protein product [Zymoseptoria tritici ST99CH_3D7]|uniref:Uncharacterized protein n=1 Tax=Zymoseptoria tritici (strain ST99CH_3D7) TaxID=1276538 RepID=A0A1X7RH52_ZYMT9|nr:unnamed protein product [Zymoseptoria tritici ST99CH_3D7]
MTERLYRLTHLLSRKWMSTKEVDGCPGAASSPVHRATSAAIRETRLAAVHALQAVQRPVAELGSSARVLSVVLVRGPLDLTPADQVSSGDARGSDDKIGDDDPVPSAADSSTLSSQRTQLTQPPTHLEICVNRSPMVVRLGEITITDALGRTLVGTDVHLFNKIREKYNEFRRQGLHNLFYRPSGIHYVRFGVQAHAQQVDIYETPDALPPSTEVQDGRYHYHECPLTVFPPMPSRTFLQYYRGHAPDCASRSNLFCTRLPKKLGSSMQSSGAGIDDLSFGWGVHISEGPNKAVLSGLAAVLILFSFFVSVVYDIVAHGKESGFAIGQWIVAAGTAVMGAAYFHLADQ